MSYCKLVSGQYKNDSDVRNVVNYIADLRKSNYLVGGGNGIINAHDIHACPDFIAEQFLFVQDIRWCRGRRLYHVIVSFDKILDEMNIMEIENTAEKLIALYSDFQSVYVLHEDTRNLHLHILFNNISLTHSKNLSNYINIMDILKSIENSIELFKSAKKH